MFIPTNNISYDHISNKLIEEAGVSLSVMRLDGIHPEVSGNKLFKLHYFAEECLGTTHKTMLTFGGAYSNHLAATAFLCREKGWRSIGIVRGEEPAQLSHTLIRCRELGMQLEFISRENYRRITNDQAYDGLRDRFGDCTIVPEGGFSLQGARGAALIHGLIEGSPTHICTAAGTATTLAGLLMQKVPAQEIIAIPVIKNMTDINARVLQLNGNDTDLPVLFNEYHFGGYAKYTDELIHFMNSFYAETRIPLDFVYTAKMMFAVTDQIKKGYFKKGSRILCLHTGGLQGNLSLHKGALIY